MRLAQTTGRHIIIRTQGPYGILQVGGFCPRSSSCISTPRLATASILDSRASWLSISPPIFFEWFTFPSSCVIVSFVLYSTICHSYLQMSLLFLPQRPLFLYNFATLLTHFISLCLTLKYFIASKRLALSTRTSLSRLRSTSHSLLDYTSAIP